MKIQIAGLAAIALIAGGSVAYAQDTTTVVTHKDASGQVSDTTVSRPDGSTKQVQRDGPDVKKTYTAPNGDQTIIKKTTTPSDQ